jgi:hypothetical protein
MDVDGRALGLAEAHGSRLGALAQEPAQQSLRELVRPADREYVLAAPGRLQLAQQLPQRAGRHGPAGH